MATNYPGEKDVWQDKVASGPVYAQDFANLQDAIEELQKKVGVDLSASDISMEYKVCNIVVASTYVYFYESSAPTGWTATLPTGDYVLGVVASDGYYNVAGQTATSTWDLSVEASTQTHSHRWMYYSAYWNYSYNSAGNASIYAGTGGSVHGKSGNNTFCISLHINSTSNDVEPHFLTSDCYTSMTSHNHTFTEGWRPAAAVGVIASYTGA